MTRMTSIASEESLVAFAAMVAARFAADPRLATLGDLKPGSLLAIRWGLGDDCVLVVRLDEEFEPVNFQQAIAQQSA